MRGLIVKDLLMLRKNAWLSGIYMIIAVLWLLMKSASDIALMMFMVFACTMGLGLYNSDEASGSVAYMRALPVSAREIVTARYIVQLLLGCLVMAVGIAVTLLLGKGTVQFLVGAIFMLGIFVGISSPIMYRFGAVRGRLLMLVAIFGVLGLGFLMVELMHVGLVSVSETQVRILAEAIPPDEGQVFFVAIDEWVESHLPLLGAAIFAAFAALIGISWAVSCRIVGRMEK